MPVRTVLCLFMAVFSLSAAPALAEAPEGWRAGVIVGLDRTDAAPGAGAANGFAYGIQVGHDWRLGPFQTGIEGDLAGSTERQTLGTRRSSHGLFGAAAIRAALPLTGGLRMFARGGYAFHALLFSGAPGFNGHGWQIGGGAEADLGRRLYLRGEYRFSNYGSAVRGQQLLFGAGLRL